MIAKITVIMPSLNVADYIVPCIKSVIGQTLRELEILCIDAGSTDGTLEILEDYAAKDERIRIIHSDKKSYGYQVNLGIKEARGEYIDIVETDDTISTEMLEILYQAAKKDNLDYCKANYYRVSEIGGTRSQIMVDVLSRSQLPDVVDRVICPSDYIEVAGHDWQIWSGIYSRDFLMNKKIYCNESAGAAYQDIGFTIQTYCLAERAKYMSECLYLYTYHREGSSSWNKNALLNAQREFQRILYGKVLPSTTLEKCHSAIMWKMASSMAGETTKLIQMLDFDINAPCLTEPYYWLRDQLLKETDEVFWKQPEVLTSAWIGKILLLVQSLDAYALYLKSQQQYEYLKSKALIDYVRKHHTGVIVFGCGIRGINALVYLQNLRLNSHLTENAFQINAITDNDSRKWHQKHFGIEVLAPDDAVTRYPDDLYLIANKYHSFEIRKQLINMGISLDQIMEFISTKIE
jgi:glycosyltransferase involved in cell wall biosynthesis